MSPSPPIPQRFQYPDSQHTVTPYDEAINSPMNYLNVPHEFWKTLSHDRILILARSRVRLRPRAGLTDHRTPHPANDCSEASSVLGTSPNNATSKFVFYVASVL
jgi:hypothetical protein